jgi:hypothetical protein
LLFLPFFWYSFKFFSSNRARTQQELESIATDAEERGQLIRRLELLGERIYKDKILVKGSQTASNMATDLNQASNAVQAVSDVANRRVGNTLIMLKTLFNLKL